MECNHEMQLALCSFLITCSALKYILLQIPAGTDERLTEGAFADKRF